MEVIFFLRVRRQPKNTNCISSAASDVYKRQSVVTGVCLGRRSGRFVIAQRQPTDHSAVNRPDENAGRNEPDATGNEYDDDPEEVAHPDGDGCAHHAGNRGQHRSPKDADERIPERLFLRLKIRHLPLFSDK